MRLPIQITSTAYIVLGAVFGAIGFAVTGAIFGFFSFLHLLSGPALAGAIIYLTPRLFVVVPDAGESE